jgi:FtsP/CotA-like multicopper oxidase with cupredoxin domain
MDSNDPVSHAEPDHLTRRAALAAGAGLPFGLLAGTAVGRVIDPTTANVRAGAVQFKPDHVLNITKTITSPLGVPVESMLVNGTDPGPEIRYTEGDTLRVLVQNRSDQPTTLHWHGLIVPNWMDGVPDITQLPIQPGQSFFIEYPIVQSGSYWYHSHVGFQEQVGLKGPFIIKEKKPRFDYDHDVTCFASDWLNQSPNGIVPQIRGDQPATAAVKPPTGKLYTLPGVLGKKPFNIDVTYPGFMLNGATNEAPWTFQCRAGDRLRLRLINGGTSATFRVALDGHDMTVIACDGNPCVPVTVDSLTIAVAERYDVLVTIKESGSFTMHWCGVGQSRQVVGVVHTADVQPKPDFGRPTFGPRYGGLGNYDIFKAPFDTTLPVGPVNTIDVSLGGDMKQYLWSMGGLYYPEAFVPKAQARNVPLQVEYGQRVRIRFTNTTMMWHPMHLHGHFFRVLSNVGDWSQRNAIVKDTIGVPPMGKVDIEFFADNPGHWFFHCHNLYHLATGMARQVHYGVDPVGL